MKNIVLSIAVIILIGAISYVDAPPIDREPMEVEEVISEELTDIVQEYPLITSNDLEALSEEGNLDEGSNIEDMPIEEESLDEGDDDASLGEWAEEEEADALSLEEEIVEGEPEEVWTYLGSYQITAYEWTGNPCANGNYPEEGYTVACNSLPFGTVVYIDGIGYRTVEDRGATWHSSQWIDLYLGDVSSCNQFGVKYLDVWVVE